MNHDGKPLDMETQRQQAFQQLRQPCVQLLQATAAFTQDPGARKYLSQPLTKLLTTLRSITATPGLLHPQLAEYAFVPLSQLLRVSREVPVRAMELCLECISALLDARWGGRLEPALSGQLLILFTFLAKPSSADNGIAATSEELQSLAFRCMAQLLAEASRTSHGKQSMTATVNIPALAEAVLVMLDRLTDSKSNSVRLEAVTALKALDGAIIDDDALASFLPKLVSSLTKLLTPTSRDRPSFRIVEQALGILSSLLRRLLSDQKTTCLPDEAPFKHSSSSTTVLRTTSWLQATASQIKVALANVFKLRYHDKPEVRRELLQLCLCVLQDCRTSLSTCASMTIEVVISLTDHTDSQISIENELRVLLSADQNLSGLLRESLYGWIISLPRLMQSKDDHSRRRIISQISVALRLVEQNQTTLDERLADSLREGIAIIFSESKGLQELQQISPAILTDRTLILRSVESSAFQPLKFRTKAQDDIMAEFKILTQELAKSDAALTLTQELIRMIDVGPLEMRLASFWISVNLIRDTMTKALPLDEFIDMGTPNLQEALLDDLYFHAVAILDQDASIADPPWYFFALALETIALQATRYKSEFRPELSEVLFPVLCHLGSSNPTLREHALVCLNIISDASGYSKAGDLVVANVDYIVNAIGLKLATGDVSPQAPQVLLMMMRLCGSSLLPYLDDLIGSIFEALERYHGYPKLAELLFSVLKGMVEEGVRAPQFALNSSDNETQCRQSRKATAMVDVVGALERLSTKRNRNNDDKDQDFNEPFPQKPWKTTSNAESGHQSDPTNVEQQPIDTQVEEHPPPVPRTYDILLNISNLTQHYLTTASPSLRSSLLSLLKTTLPALAKHENSFLPLIHTLWPVLIPRLQDPEAYVVSNALGIIALMCQHARDFMRTRIEDAWDLIRAVYQRTQHQTHGLSKTDNFNSIPLNVSNVENDIAKLSIGLYQTTVSFQPGLPVYVDRPTRMIWSGLVDLLCTICKYVALREERFDELLDILDPVLDTDYVREALEHSNPDAVWLRLYKKSQQKSVEKPTNLPFPAHTFTPTIRVPVGRPHWQFVPL